MCQIFFALNLTLIYFRELLSRKQHESLLIIMKKNNNTNYSPFYHH